MRRLTKNSIVTIDDLLKFAGAVSYTGKVESNFLGKIEQIKDVDFCFGMFLNNIEADLLKEGIDFSKLKGKNKQQVKDYLQGRIDSIVNRYMEEYNINVDKMIGKKYFVIDKNKHYSQFTLYTIQHLLRINGYEISDGMPGEVTRDHNQEIEQSRDNIVKMPLSSKGKSLDEKSILDRFRCGEYIGHSRILFELKKLSPSNKR